MLARGSFATPGTGSTTAIRCSAKASRGILQAGGVETVKLPARSPNLNAYAERFVRSIQSECLSKIIPLGERHLRLAVSEYVEHDQGKGIPKVSTTG